MARFGPEKDFEKEQQLFRAIEDGFCRLFGEIPGDEVEMRLKQYGANDFVGLQFSRFGVTIPPAINFLYDFGLRGMCDYLSWVDPYILFFEYSDVVMTTEWAEYTYEVAYPGGRVIEVSPEVIETYKAAPTQGREFFEKHLSMPGCEAFPSMLCHSCMELFNDYLYDEGMTSLGGYFKSDLFYALCKHVMSEEREKIWPYFNLSLWAATLWMFGPLSSELRKNYCEVTDTVLNFGECILYNGEVFEPKHYRKIPRAPESCYKCGIDAWCVENTFDDFGVIRNICESCMRGGDRTTEDATCGSMVCKYWDCPHNKFHMDPNGQMGAMRQHGQLSQAARKVRAELSGPEKRLAIG